MRILHTMLRVGNLQRSIDFYRDVQKGDRMRAVIEKTVHKGRTLEYGNVLAAEYIGSSVGTKRTFRYHLPDGTDSYFAEDGTSARKTFLKSPLKFAQVTSGFGGRFHPILNYYGAHNGVDFNAAMGTPVWAVVVLALVALVELLLQR